MRNLFNTPRLLDAQKRLNSVLDRLEEAIAETSSFNGGEELLLENEELKEEIEDLMKQQKETELFKKKIAKKLDETIKPLEEILNGNS